jgi:hypothetical protein
MTTTDLPFRATTEQACDWLAQQTGAPWTLPQLLASGLIPYVWLDYDPAFPDLFGEANGGYPAPIFFEGDTRRLAEGSEDVLITITKDVYKIVTTLPPPGFRRALHELRFQKRDLERLAGQIRRDAEPPKPELAKETQEGINREQVLAAFARLVKLDLDRALTEAGGIFGDDGARVKASAKKSAKNAVWNPVTLALGLNEVYRVPLPQLRRAFKTHDFLAPWEGNWNQTLALLGK